MILNMKDLLLSIQNRFSLQENIDISEYQLDTPLDVTLYTHLDKRYFVDKDNNVYEEIPTYLNKTLGKKIGIMKNKCIYIDKKIDLNCKY